MKYYPFYDKEKISFIRKENNNYWIIRLKEFPELSDLLINHITKEIFELCNGKNDIENIVTNLQSKYQNVNLDLIRNDIGLILSKFSRMGVIQWNDNNDPYIVTNQKFFDNNYKIRYATESDYKLVFDYINQNKENFYKFIDYYNQNYSDLTVRAKIFYKMEDFFILLNPENQIECMIGIQKNDSKNIYKDARITFISNINNTENIIFLLNYIKLTIQDFSFQKILKLRCIVDENKLNQIQNALISCNFKFEASLSNEIDESKKISIYSACIKNE